MAEFTVFPAKMEQRPQNIRNMAGTMNRYISSIGNVERNLAVPTDITLLACGTSTPDQLLSSHASMVHGELGNFL